MEAKLKEIEAALASISDSDNDVRKASITKIDDFRNSQSAIDYVPLILSNPYSLPLKRIACQLYSEKIKETWMFGEPEAYIEAIGRLFKYIDLNSNDAETFGNLQGILAEIITFDGAKTYKNFFIDIFARGKPLFKTISILAGNITSDMNDLMEEFKNHLPVIIQNILKFIPEETAIQAFTQIIKYTTWSYLKQVDFPKIFDKMCPELFIPITNVLLLNDIEIQYIAQGFKALSTVFSIVGDDLLEIIPLLMRYFALLESPELIDSLHKAHAELLKISYFEVAEYWEFFAMLVSHDKERRKIYQNTISELLVTTSYNIITPPCYVSADDTSILPQFEQQAAIINSLYRIQHEPANSYIFHTLNELVTEFNAETFNSMIWLMYNMKKSKFEKVVPALMNYFNKAVGTQARNAILMKGFLFVTREIFAPLKLPQKLTKYIFDNSIFFIKNSILQNECVNLLLAFAMNGKFSPNTPTALTSSALLPENIKILSHSSALTDLKLTLGTIKSKFADILNSPIFPQKYIQQVALLIASLAGIARANHEFLSKFIKKHAEMLTQWQISLFELFIINKEKSVMDILNDYAILAYYYENPFITVFLNYFNIIPPSMYKSDTIKCFECLMKPDEDNKLLEVLKSNVIIKMEFAYSNQMQVPPSVFESFCHLISVLAEKRFDFFYQDDILFLIYFITASQEPGLVCLTLANVFESANNLLNAPSFQKFSDNFWGILYNAFKSLMTEAPLTSILDIGSAIERIARVARPSVDGTSQVCNRLIRDFPRCSSVIQPALIKEILSGDWKVSTRHMIHIISCARQIPVDVIVNILERHKFRLKYV